MSDNFTAMLGLADFKGGGTPWVSLPSLQWTFPVLSSRGFSRCSFPKGKQLLSRSSLSCFDLDVTWIWLKHTWTSSFHCMSVISWQSGLAMYAMSLIGGQPGSHGVNWHWLRVPIPHSLGEFSELDSIWILIQARVAESVIQKLLGLNDAQTMVAVTKPHTFHFSPAL